MTKRALIQSKFGNRCAYCGTELDYKAVTLDHVIPKSKGGTREETNLYPACKKCNGLKRDLSLDDFRKVVGGLFYFEQKANDERELLDRFNKINALENRVRDLEIKVKAFEDKKKSEGCVSCSRCDWKYICGHAPVKYKGLG